MTSKQNQPDGTFLNYYEMIDEEVLLTAKQQIMNLIEEGYDNGYLSKEEFEALDPSDKGASRFYQIFKVHKSHPPGGNVEMAQSQKCLQNTQITT